MTPPGQIARRLLGRQFEALGNIYRRIFVDLQRIVNVFERELPPNARVLDIGGGDGALIERLLNRRPDLAITMCDLAPRIGFFLSKPNRAKVKLLPATDFAEVAGNFDAIMISDVIHHVPVDRRDVFFAALAKSRVDWGARKLILKDIESSGFRAKLAVWADHHVTGDKHVVPFTRASFAKVAQQYFSDASRKSEMPDKPNYCEVLSW